ncbi:MAG: gamma-glutamyl-gamma-aminobutyrate hydrolase family protein [Anaerolineales bacterium]|nr:gamma-glutamyl-gamma-aminobutyrate hydrolase family protein [Anaerolineales bacterium]
MTRPLIGLTTIRFLTEDGSTRDGITKEYSQAVVQAGGLPVLIPLATVEDNDPDILRALYERLDGILIPGGGDVHPSEYGQYVTDHERGISYLRDKAELQLIRWAYDDDRPTFGICRGHQIMNVAMGGTLLHDVVAATGTTIRHDRDDIVNGRRELAHDVELKADSRLYSIFGNSRVAVNSLHHQAVETVAPTLMATAYAEDGIIEGIEAPNAHFFVGVQWHPEGLVGHVPAMRGLFEQFIEACKTKKPVVL